MSGNSAIAVVFFLFMTFTLLLPGPTFAVEDETLDEIINGFDDKKSETSADTMQDVLEGFDDEPKDAGVNVFCDDLNGLEQDYNNIKQFCKLLYQCILINSLSRRYSRPVHQVIC